MSIHYLEAHQQFHLRTNHTSYLIQLDPSGQLVHGYWGARIHDPNLKQLVDLYEVASFSPNPIEKRPEISFDTLPREYPDYGRSDYQGPAFEVSLENGSHIVDPVYKGHRIFNGKLALPGLPATFHHDDEMVMTLEIDLEDSLTGLSICLSYAVFESLDVITRSVRFINKGKDPIRLLRALSASVDFYQDHDFELLNLYGAWGRERHISRIPIGRSSHQIDSKRGASSHEQNPFMALLRPETTYDHGEVYSMNFVYSGSFLGEVSVNAYGGTRMMMGLHTIDFEWKLKADETFHTPEVVMVYSNEGLLGMSQIYHKFYTNCLIPSDWVKGPRPILMNNWEATYFNFTEDKIKALIDQGAALGMELFVLDDGWFGIRDNDRSGLGDWFVNEKKLPGGLTAIADYAHEKGMKFGLWFEPEMISKDSDLYRQHPDWCLHVPGRYRIEGRNQLILDMSRAEVQDYIIERLTTILKDHPIDYVKWDMNRNMTDVGSKGLPKDQQKETSFRYMLGVYRVMEKITSTFSEVLFESCSGGGGRFDPGMLYYMPQTWTSDDTDAFERLKIQWGTALVYPPSAIASHVSEVPNHQVGRITPLKSRGHVAMSMNLGYELDLTKLTDEEKSTVADQIVTYKKIRTTVQQGKFYGLLDPYGNEGTAYMYISPKKDQAVVFFFRHLAKANNIEKKLKLKGLKADCLYELEDGRQVYGDVLMNFGLRIPLDHGDFTTAMVMIKKVK